MRGKTRPQVSMLALVSIDSLVPPRHPLREMKPVVDGILQELSPVFSSMYAADGRPSVPPERLLKSMVLMALYGVRSERLFCEQLGYNMLFRWFLDMDMTDKVFVPTGVDLALSGAFMRPPGPAFARWVGAASWLGSSEMTLRETGG